MREIKFRVWNKWENQYDQETLLEFDYKDNSYEFTNLVSLRDLNNPAYILEQYTGLKDKNGKEIYEGDILGFELDGKEPCITIVKYSIDCFVSDNDGYKVPLAEERNLYPDLEVIGNIHENPELL